MTDDQEAAAFRSIAEELTKLAHAKPIPDDDEEDRYFSYLFRTVPMLCPHHLAALSNLVEALFNQQGDERKQVEERIVQ